MESEKEEMETIAYETSSQRRKSGVIVSYVYMAAQIVVQLVYVPLLLRGIGQEEYGLYQLVGSVMAYIVSINGVLSAGVGRYYCHYLLSGDVRNSENTLAIAKRLYWVLSAISALVVAVLMAVFRMAFAGSFSEWQINECCLMLVVLTANAIVTMNNTISVAAITAYERFAFLKLSQLVALVIQPIVVIAAISVMSNALVVTVVVLVMNIICASTQRLYAGNVLKARHTYHGWDGELAKGLLRFSASVIMVIIADQIFWKTDQLVIGYFFGPSLVAVYAVGAQIYQAYISVGTVIPSLFLPRVTELCNHDSSMCEVSELYARVGRISCIVCIAVFGAFAVVGEDFVALWAGDQYRDAYFISLIVMAAFTIDIIQSLSNTVLQVLDRYYFRGAVLSAAALINIVCTIVLIQSVGIVGAAVSTAICILIGNGVVMNWYMARRVGIKVGLFYHEVSPLLSLGFFLTAICCVLYRLLPLQHSSWLLVFGASATYIALLCVILWKCGLNEYERCTAKNIVYEIRKR